MNIIDNGSWVRAALCRPRPNSNIQFSKIATVAVRRNLGDFVGHGSSERATDNRVVAVSNPTDTASKLGQPSSFTYPTLTVSLPRHSHAG